jgi:hypothetical protein
MKRSSHPINKFSLSWQISILKANLRHNFDNGFLITFNELAGWRRDLAGAAGLALAFDPVWSAAS